MFVFTLAGGIVFSSIYRKTMATKKKAGKEAHTAYVTFENVGKSGVCPSIQGKEVRLQDAQAISNRR